MSYENLCKSQRLYFIPVVLFTLSFTFFVAGNVLRFQECGSTESSSNTKDFDATLI